MLTTYLLCSFLFQQTSLWKRFGLVLQIKTFRLSVANKKRIGQSLTESDRTRSVQQLTKWNFSFFSIFWRIKFKGLYFGVLNSAGTFSLGVPHNGPKPRRPSLVRPVEAAQVVFIWISPLLIIL